MTDRQDTNAWKFGRIVGNIVGFTIAGCIVALVVAGTIRAVEQMLS